MWILWVIAKATPHFTASCPHYTHRDSCLDVELEQDWAVLVSFLPREAPLSSSFFFIPMLRSLEGSHKAQPHLRKKALCSLRAENASKLFRMLLWEKFISLLSPECINLLIHFFHRYTCILIWDNSALFFKFSSIGLWLCLWVPRLLWHAPVKVNF